MSEIKATHLNALIAPASDPLPVIYDNYRKLIFIDPQTREISYDRRVKFMFWKKYQAFLTDNQKMIDLRRSMFRFHDLRAGKETNILIDCRMQLIAGREYKAVMLLHREDNYDEAFVNHIISWIRQYAAKQERFIDAFFEKERELLEYLKQKATNHGFQLELKLALQGIIIPGQPQEYFTLTEKIPCTIRDASNVDLHCTLLVNLIDERRLRMHAISNVEAWVKKQLVQIAQNTMIRKSFADLLKNPDLSMIEEELRKKMEMIGYSVKQLTTVPEIAGISSDFNFSTRERQTPGEEKYYTNQRDVQVKLRVNVKGEIKSFYGNIERYLKPGTDIVELMREEAVHTIEHFMIKVDPSRFYMYFRHPEEDGKRTLEAELTEALDRMLADKFNVINAQFSFLQLETDLVKRCDALRSRFSNFTFQTYKKNIKVSVTYRVEGVAPQGWYLFQPLNFATIEDELNQVSDLLMAKIEARLASIKNIDLITLRGKDIEHYVGQLFDYAARAVEATHGLAVRYCSCKLMATEVDSRIAEKLQDEVDDYLEKQAKKDLEAGKRQQEEAPDDLFIVRTPERKQLSDDPFNENITGNNENDPA